MDKLGTIAIDNEELFSKLIIRLIQNLIPSCKDKEQRDHYLSYSQRLLNTRMNPTTNNESTIIQMISDKGNIFMNTFKPSFYDFSFL